MRTLLCREKNSRIKVVVWAEIIDDCLIITGYNTGNACIEQWGKYDHEYKYIFDQNNTRLLFNFLSKGNDDSNLMVLVIENFNGMHGCEKLREFCEPNNIKYSIST